MPDALTKFVHDENIRNFTKQIEAETDPVRLALLRALLKEEEARLIPLVEPKKPVIPHG